jgi:hypothetical protein
MASCAHHAKNQSNITTRHRLQHDILSGKPDVTPLPEYRNSYARITFPFLDLEFLFK